MKLKGPKGFSLSGIYASTGYIYNESYLKPHLHQASLLMHDFLFNSLFADALSWGPLFQNRAATATRVTLFLVCAIIGLYLIGAGKSKKNLVLAYKICPDISINPLLAYTRRFHRYAYTTGSNLDLFSGDFSGLKILSSVSFRQRFTRAFQQRVCLWRR